ncbi:MAG: hypothetical protein VX276_02080, partial [Pseudomonadota bacterium]|nr:hypothetical protein [Pseudomonadota bacterium]
MKINIKSVMALCSLFLTLMPISLAQNSAAPQSLREKLVQAIEFASQNQLQIISLKATPLSTIYEVELSTGEIL